MAPVSMIGKHFITLKHFTPAEIKTLLWTAMDLKARYKGLLEEEEEEVNHTVLRNARFTLVLDNVVGTFRA